MPQMNCAKDLARDMSKMDRGSEDSTSNGKLTETEYCWK